MLEIRNHTPLTVTLIPGLDKNGNDYASVVMKGKFVIKPGQKRLEFCDEPAAINEQDIHYGEPDKTSVRYESDMVPYKRATDIIVLGHAYPEQQKRAISVDATVTIGKRSKTCRVFGDRVWEKSSKAVLSWEPSQAVPFERMPIIYEKAFGGVDRSNPDDKSPPFYNKNPLGMGYLETKNGLSEGVPLPNIEDPRQLIERWNDRPLPAGFGYIGRAWQPRVAYAGTYDDQWKKKRLPLLPLDFDDRFFNGAHSELIEPEYLVGGENVVLKNLTPSGLLAFELPVWKDTVTFSMVGGEKTKLQPILDTVVLEPDMNSVTLTWRATMPCRRDFLYIDSVTVGTKRQK